MSFRFYVLFWMTGLALSTKLLSAQEQLLPVKNIFSVVSNDPQESLWTLKKTAIFRVNVVKMTGVSKRHKHPDAEHSILVIKGKIRAEINGQLVKLKKGDLLSIPAGVPHKYTVKGRKAIIVSMDAPYYDPGKTIILE